MRKTSEVMHARLCSACGESIFYSYYLYQYGNGEIYSAAYTSNNVTDRACFEYCQLSDGTRITCQNGGICSVCGAWWNPEHKLYIGERTGKVYCWICNKEFGEVSANVTSDGNSPATYTIQYDVKLKNGAKFQRYVLIDGLTSYGMGSENGYITNLNSDSTEFTINITAQFNDGIEAGAEYLGVVLLGSVDGVDCSIHSDSEDHIYYPDEKAPVITSIETGTNDSWSRNKNIEIIGIENYCSIVNVKIENDRGKTVYEGKANVVNKNWSISCIPEIEAGEEARTFKVTVTDSCENSITQDFDISKVDGRPPAVTSSDRATDSEWAKEKTFTFTAEDLGIGNVEIGFNDVNDYSPAIKNVKNYSKAYKFVGDAYSEVQASVYFKDGLGNITTQVVTLEKIDNTAPTITNAILNNNAVHITAHDRHSSLGEGSGVVKYRYITSTEKLENPQITDNNSQEIEKNTELKIPNISQIKYIYIVAEDLVGNISASYEIEVPQLELTSRVNLDGTNGKGTILLDWTGYDITNKYFVIYRKQEGEEEWKTIIGIGEKLNNNTYTDTLGNDITKPSIPEMTIEKNIETNQIKINQQTIDNGTEYKYYIEAYDKNTGVLIAKSNIN